MAKILVLANMFPSKKYPFYGIFVQNTNRILQNFGYEVKMISITKTTSKLLRVWKYVTFFFRSLFNLVFISYDLIYIHYPAFSAIPLLFMPKLRCKLITNIHGNDLVPEGGKDKIFIHFTNIAVKRSNYVILPSYYFKRVFETKYPSFPKNNIFVSPSGGVDRSLFEPENKVVAKRKLKISEKNRYIGFVSRIEKDKGWDIFVDMVSRIHSKVPNYKFILVGSGSEENQLEKMIKERGLEDYIIKFSYLSHEQLVHVFNAIDILCFPSLRKSESLGLVGLEAMACECIVISSAGTGPESYIENNFSGFILNNMNSRFLADEVLDVLGLPDRKILEIKKQAEKTTRQYSMDAVSSNLTGFIHEKCNI